MKYIKPNYNIGNKFIKNLDYDYFWKDKLDKYCFNIMKIDVMDLFIYIDNIDKLNYLIKNNNLIYIFYKCIFDIGYKDKIKKYKIYSKLKKSLYYDINEGDLNIFKKNNIIYVKSRDKTKLIYNINLNKIIYNRYIIIIKNGIILNYFNNELNYYYDINKGILKNDIDKRGFLVNRKYNTKAIEIKKKKNKIKYEMVEYIDKHLLQINYVININNWRLYN